MTSSAAAAPEGGQAVVDEENPFVRAMEDWRSRTPMLCRMMATGIVVSYLASWIVDLSPVLACIPFSIVYKYQVWRLIASPVVGNSLIGTLFACITIGDGVGPKLERSLGTASFGALAGLAVLGVNVTFVLLCYGASLGGTPTSAFAVSSGVWGPLLSLITVESLSAPEATRRLFFLPIEIPRLYYPLALGGIFVILSGVKLDMMLGIALGYAEHYGYLDPLRPSTAALSRFEQRCSLPVTDPAYVTSRAALGAAAWVQLSQDALWAQQSAGGGDDRRRENGSVTHRLNGMLDALRNRTTSQYNESEGSSNSNRQNHFVPFQNSSPGHVLGSAPSTHLAPTASSSSGNPQQQPPQQHKTAAANRATILAAVEKRTAQQEGKGDQAV